MIYLFIATGALHIENSTPELERLYVARLNASAEAIAADLMLGAQETLMEARRRSRTFQVELRSVHVEFSVGSIEFLIRFVFDTAVTALASDPATAISNASAIAGLCITAVKAGVRMLEFALGRAEALPNNNPPTFRELQIFTVDVMPYQKFPTGSTNGQIIPSLLFFMLALCLLLQALIVLQLVSMLS
jgi:hypothetical protein